MTLYLHCCLFFKLSLWHAMVCPQQDLCTDNTAIQTEIVGKHNEFRRNVRPAAADMLKMNYNETIAATAQDWVDKCTLSHGEPSTRMLDGYEMGENLFYSSLPYSWTAVIAAWHNEVEHYEYPNVAKNNKTIGHFTQVVWYSSYEVGCGMALCPNNIYYYGCHYYRAGNINYDGWRPYTKSSNGKSCDLCPGHCENKLCTNPCPERNTVLDCEEKIQAMGCNGSLSGYCDGSCNCSDKIISIG